MSDWYGRRQAPQANTCSRWSYPGLYHWSSETWAWCFWTPGPKADVTVPAQTLLLATYGVRNWKLLQPVQLVSGVEKAWHRDSTITWSAAYHATHAVGGNGLLQVRDGFERDGRHAGPHRCSHQVDSSHPTSDTRIVHHDFVKYQDNDKYP